MKKKLDETYLPDKESRKRRVVVGLSGGLNSFVTCYLLKIQKYDLIGITIQMPWEDEAEPSKYLSCHLDQSKVDAIKEFCHQLGISHFTVKASEEFKDKVIDRWMSSRIDGTRPTPCWSCHELRMSILHQKMIELDAQAMATGHLAKIYRQESHGTVYVHSSNDEVFDQSSILSRVPHEILNKLMLPLSDLQQKEINKLAENFGISASDKKIDFHQCLDIDHSPLEFLEKNIPKKYRPNGEIVLEDKTVLGEHTGVFKNAMGESFTLPHHKATDDYRMIGYSLSDKRITIAKSEQLKQKKIFLTHCVVSEETPWYEPLKGVVKINHHEYADCWIYPKNLDSAYVEMDNPHLIIEGEIITVLRKKGKNSKVFLTGKARYVDEGPVSQGEGKANVKVDYSRDY